MLFVLQLLQLAAKRLMMRLAIQQLGKHDRFPPHWLLHAVTCEGKSVVTLTRWIWTPWRPSCRSANRSIRSETQYGRLSRAKGTAGGGLLLASRLFHISLSYFSARTESVWSPKRRSCDQTCRVLWNYSTFWHFYCLLLDLWISATDWIHVPVKNKRKRCPGTCLFMFYEWGPANKYELFLQRHREAIIREFNKKRTTSLHVHLHVEHDAGKPLQIDTWLHWMTILTSNHHCLTSWRKGGEEVQGGVFCCRIFV